MVPFLLLSTAKMGLLVLFWVEWQKKLYVLAGVFLRLVPISSIFCVKRGEAI